MYYNEELKREQSTGEVVAGIALMVVVVVCVWSFLDKASK